MDANHITFEDKTVPGTLNPEVSDETKFITAENINEIKKSVNANADILDIFIENESQLSSLIPAINQIKRILDEL